ncbi:uncharacterized protein N7469_010176 [Penicillium citrinum]|uniref:Uncharacterized protein n=1 Tax=Penicillium citrinum TaxID=5077 RepID=A0A9W9NMD7_PENCI|nr:uncharacterized protein N7469_010176 [Penicillium citrinum]KAJ5221289.1 hypothetical protein N7469_010176 [Penicillium citrinum]KAK5798161.1 hypothetical protein VI817_004452 [Penicillium citrinum]
MSKGILDSLEKARLLYGCLLKGSTREFIHNAVEILSKDKEYVFDDGIYASLDVLFDQVINIMDKDATGLRYPGILDSLQ